MSEATVPQNKTDEALPKCVSCGRNCCNCRLCVAHKGKRDICTPCKRAAEEAKEAKA